MATTTAVPVTRSLWESLEAVLDAQSRILIKDIARSLRQDEKVLLNEYRKDKTTAYLVDMNEPTNEKFQCEALADETTIVKRCRRPVLFGNKRCPEHVTWKEPYANKPTLRRIENDSEIYFVEVHPFGETKTVYNEDHENVGFMENGKVYLFEEVV